MATKRNQKKPEHKMKQYFVSCIGKRHHLSVVTGDDLFIGVYCRKYTADTLCVEDNSVTFMVKSVDIVPSGYIRSGSEKSFGQHSIDLDDDVNDMFFNVVKKADPEFFKKYPNANRK